MIYTVYSFDSIFFREKWSSVSMKKDKIDIFARQNSS